MSATALAIDAAAPLLADPSRVATQLDRAQAPEAIARLQAALGRTTGRSAALPPSNGTAVISIADADGNGVTIVQSIFTPFGSMVADAATGIVLNNRLLGFSVDPSHPNFVEAAKRPAHTLSPAMVLENGRLRMLLGTPGGTGQTITLTQVLTNVVDFGLDLKDAVALPRWSMDIGGNLVVEAAIGADVVKSLNACGLNVRTATPAQRFFFGSAECIAIQDGQLTAVADDRRDAYAAAL